MKLVSLGRFLAVPACVGMMLPAAANAQQKPSSARPTVERPADPMTPQAEPAAAIRDVALGSGGTLSGKVVDAQGAAQASATVVVLRSGQEVGRAVTDREGSFSVNGLRGGVYQVASGQSTAMFRLWSGGAAPPSARSSALIVCGETLRGQSRLSNIFTSDGFIIGAVIAAAIAIPVVINNMDDENGS